MTKPLRMFLRPVFVIARPFSVRFTGEFRCYVRVCNLINGDVEVYVYRVLFIRGGAPKIWVSFVEIVINSEWNQEHCSSYSRVK